MVAGNTFFFDWEVSLMLWLQAHLGSFGLTLASLCSAMGEELVLILVMGFLYWCWDKELGIRLGTNLCAALVWNPMVKNVAMRRRPYFDTPVVCYRPVDPSADINDIAAQGFSFPSGHSSQSAAAYGSFAFYRKERWAKVVGIVLPLLVGISRFCVGVHYPTDVLCGWLLGCGAIFLLPMVERLFPQKWMFYLALILTGLPGFFYCTTTDYFTAYGIMIGFFSGSLFEQRFVRFQSTRIWWKVLLRLTGGVGIFFLLSSLLKLPFSEAFLDSGTVAAHLVRTCRYIIILFLDIGVYPLLFDRSGGKTE